MGYKQMDQHMTFAEVSLLTSMEHNRSLKRLEKINQAIDWSEVEAVISAHYTVGTGNEGADAYPPLLFRDVNADKGYYGAPNREFLAMNGIADGIMRKGTRSTFLTAWEKKRNKAIAKLRYIVEQYFGLSHLHTDAFRARFTRIIKNGIDALFRQMAFNIFRGGKVLGTI